MSLGKLHVFDGFPKGLNLDLFCHSRAKSSDLVVGWEYSEIHLRSATSVDCNYMGQSSSVSFPQV